jgi:hypothetical protein
MPAVSGGTSHDFKHGNPADDSRGGRHSKPRWDGRSVIDAAPRYVESLNRHTLFN